MFVDRRSPRLSRVALPLLALALAAPAGGAQVIVTPAPPVDSAAAPYRALAWSAGGVAITSSGRLADYWTAGRGIAAAVRTPFHVGEVGLSVATTRYRARTAAQGDYRAFLIAADWRLALDAPLRPALTLRAGDFLTTFDGVETKGLGKESEIFGGASLLASLPLARRTRLVVEGSAAQVLTSTPIRLVYATVWVEHETRTPRWIRRVLE